MTIDRTFELLGGDIVQTPTDTLLVLNKTTWGGMVLREMTIESEVPYLNYLYRSRDWIRLLDDRFGRTRWTLYRRYGAADWIALPRPGDV